MTDQRMKAYEEAMKAMARGRFNVEVPLGSDPEDEIARLGSALHSLGKSLDKKLGQLNWVSRVTEKVNSGLLLDDILTDVYESFHNMIPYDRIGFAFLEEVGGERRVRAHWARTEAEAMRITAGFSAPLKGSSLAEIIRTGKPRILNDLESYLADHPNSTSTQLIVEEGMRSSLTCPLVANGKLVGFLFFSSKERNSFEEGHVDLLSKIAGHLSLIVDKSRLYQELLDLNRLKNKFMGIAAHDLRNPLNAVEGYLFLLAEGHYGNVSETQRGIIQIVRAQGHEMLELLEGILDVNVIQSGHLKLELVSTSLKTILEEELKSVGQRAEGKSIRLELVAVEGPIQVRADPRRIGQVLANLISNAVKYSHPGTSTTVRALTHKGFAYVAIEDQGQGIPPRRGGESLHRFRANQRQTHGRRTEHRVGAGHRKTDRRSPRRNGLRRELSGGRLHISVHPSAGCGGVANGKHLAVGQLLIEHLPPGVSPLWLPMLSALDPGHLHTTDGIPEFDLGQRPLHRGEEGFMIQLVQKA